MGLCMVQCIAGFEVHRLWNNLLFLEEQEVQALSWRGQTTKNVGMICSGMMRNDALDSFKFGADEAK